jgi:DNA modification methylase
MLKNLKNTYDSSVDATEVLLTRPSIPADYHCTCDYCRTNFLGEIYNTDIDKYYSQKARAHYYPPVGDKHLAPGHFLGYRWAIQQFSSVGDWILDPTVGTGTAIVEAINHDRNGIGIELEYPHIAGRNVAHQYRRIIDPAKGKHILIAGDARNLSNELSAHGVLPGSIDLVLNGTPYPRMASGYSSDAPQRTLRIKDGVKTEKTFNYENANNFGLQRGDEFWSLIERMYTDCVPFMKRGAKMVILIKDMVQGGQPYLLHKMVIDRILGACPELQYYGSYIHKHIPQTVFMLSYPKQYPDAGQIPLYQTGIILEKK